MATELEKNCTLKFSDDVAMTAALREATKFDREVVEEIRKEVEGIDQSFQEEKEEIDIKHADVVVKHGEVIAAKNEVNDRKAEIDVIQADVTAKQTDVTTKRDEVNTTYNLVVEQNKEIQEDITEFNQSVIDVNTTIDDFNNTTAAKKQEIIDEGNTQVSRVTDKGTEQNNLLLSTGATEQQQVQQEGSAQLSLINTLSTNEQAEITQTGDAEIARVKAEGDTQENRITAAGSNELVDITDKANEQIGRVTAAGDAELAKVEGSGDTEIAEIRAEGDIQEARAKVEADRAKAEADNATSQANRAATEANTATTQAETATTQAGIATTQASNASQSATAADAAKVDAEKARDDATAIVHDGEGSLVPGAGKYPVADSEGHIDKGWISELDNLSVVNEVTTLDGEVNLKGTTTLDGEVNLKERLNLPDDFSLATDNGVIIEGEGSYGYTPKCTGNDGYLVIPKWTGKGDFEIECSVVYATTNNRDMLFDNTDVSSINSGNCWGIHRRGTDSTSPNKIDVQWSNDQLSEIILISSGTVIADSGILHNYNLIKSGQNFYFYDNNKLIGSYNLTTNGSFSIDTLLTGYNRNPIYELQGQIYYFKITDHTTPKNSRHYDFVKKQLTVPSDSELLIPDLLDSGTYRFTPAFRGNQYGRIPDWKPNNDEIGYSIEIDCYIQNEKRDIWDARIIGSVENGNGYNSLGWNDNYFQASAETLYDYAPANILITDNTRNTCKAIFKKIKNTWEVGYEVNGNNAGNFQTNFNTGISGINSIGKWYTDSSQFIGQIYSTRLTDLDNPNNSRYYDFTQLAEVAPDDGELVVQEGERFIECNSSTDLSKIWQTPGTGVNATADSLTFYSLIDENNSAHLGIPRRDKLGGRIKVTFDVEFVDKNSKFQCWLSEVGEQGAKQYYEDIPSVSGTYSKIFDAQGWGYLYDFSFRITKKAHVIVRNINVESIYSSNQLIDQTDYRNSLTSSDDNTVTVNADSLVFNNALGSGDYAELLLPSELPSGTIINVNINITNLSFGNYQVNSYDFIGNTATGSIIGTANDLGIKKGRLTTNNSLLRRIRINTPTNGSSFTVKEISITVSYPCTLTGFSSPVWEKVVGETGPGVLTNFPVEQIVDQGDYRNSLISSNINTIIINSDSVVFQNSSASGDQVDILQKVINPIISGSIITTSINVTEISSGAIWIGSSGGTLIPNVTKSGIYNNTITVTNNLTYLLLDAQIDGTSATIKDISITVRRPGNTDPVWEKLDPAYVGEILGVSSDRLQYMGEALRTVNDGDFDVPVQLNPATVPQNPQAGTVYFDSDSSQFKGYNGTDWVILG